MMSHTLNVVLDRDTVILRAVCHEKDEADCRRACERGCEEACEDPTSHMRPVGYCLAVEWIHLESCMAESYAGDGELRLHDGMEIDLRWNGDDYEWVAVKDSDTNGTDNA